MRTWNSGSDWIGGKGSKKYGTRMDFWLEEGGEKCLGQLIFSVDIGANAYYTHVVFKKANLTTEI